MSLMTNLLILVLVIFLMITASFSIYGLVEFSKIKFTQESEDSTQYDWSIALMWTQIILSVLVTLFPIGMSIWRATKGEGIHYGVPLVALIFVLFVTMCLNIATYAMFRDLKTEATEESAAHRFVSLYYFAGSLVSMFLFITVIAVWWNVKTVTSPEYQKYKDDLKLQRKKEEIAALKGVDPEYKQLLMEREALKQIRKREERAKEEAYREKVEQDVRRKQLESEASRLKQKQDELSAQLAGKEDVESQLRQLKLRQNVLKEQLSGSGSGNLFDNSSSSSGGVFPRW